MLEFTPDGKFVKVYASGIRNCVGEAINPTTGQLWCSVNERDALGDNLVPDYITHVQEGGFYGWPWYYMGDHQDPRHKGKHPELASKVIVPDVLLQPHFASLEMTFYEGKQFPASYKGWAFAAEHGSWNKSKRAGYEVIAVPIENGKATGEYQDFLTGFVTPDGNVWGRPVGVTFANDGSLFVTDDGSNSVWHVTLHRREAAGGQVVLSAIHPKGVRKTRTPFRFSALALASRRDIRVESRRTAARHAQRLPLLRFQMLRQKHNLAYVIAVVRDLPVDGLHYRVALAADEGFAGDVRIRQWSERGEHAVPPRVP